MLFIPLEKKIDWTHPPIITIGLIVLNFICYFGFQSNDDENYFNAVQYYFKSGLSKIEAPHYAEYLEKKNNMFSAFIAEEKKAKELTEKERYELFSKMINDGLFLVELEEDRVITSKDKSYKEWKKLSIEFNARLNKATFYSFGIKSYKVTLKALFSHMFLHASFEHLFWNMVFLFIFGFSVEMILGWKIYLPAYLLAGIGSALFYILLEPNNATPGIGASGAISGLTGLYTVLFGMRKIRFFYFLFVFFDTVKAPAVIILPLWLGYELYNHYFIPTNINNLAHAGGLVSGALIAYLSKKFYKNINLNYMDENNVKELYDRRFSEALSAIAAFKFDDAKTILLQLNEEQPKDIDVLKQLFNLYKRDPGSKEFHDFAKKILLMENRTAHESKVIADVYNEYIEKAQPKPKLTAENMLLLSTIFLQTNYIEEAEKIILLLLKNKIRSEKIKNNLEILINKYKLTNNVKLKRITDIYNKLILNNEFI